ncbi:MAG: hypothetical protein Q9168_001770 [Polycauliona sp. 1 TL-2023]
MDHLPYPVSTSVLPIQVPLLVLETVWGSDELSADLEKAERSRIAPTEADCTTNREYSAVSGPEVGFGSPIDWTLDFWNYPQKQGWVVTGSLSWWTSSVDQTVKRGQEWMYFELLHQFLGQPVEVSSLARKDENSGGTFLDTSTLPELLNQWSKHQHTLQQDVQICPGTGPGGLKKDSPVLSLLNRVVLESSRLDDLPEPAKSTGLAIKVLVETLTNALCSLAHVKVTAIRHMQTLEKVSLLENRFLTNGWCPFQLARLWGQYSPSTTYYLSSLPREDTFSGVKHNQCDKTRCMTTSIDPSTYAHRHVASCSTRDGSCRMVGVRSAEVADCIRRGRVPLVRFEESVDGSIRPELVESCNGSRYVALSHVWSGGLGNVNLNSMYSCQIRKLYNLLLRLRDTGDDDFDRNLGTRKFPDAFRELRKRFGMPSPEPPVLLWIDTLCVPVGEENQGVRQSAIAQMAQIYVEAQCVLVVDPELEKMNHKGLSDEQIFASVLCSSWNSRSWTFQEACMARLFYVQFRDGHCVVDEKWHKYMKRIDDPTLSDTVKSGTPGQVFDTHDVLMAAVSDWFRTMPLMTKIRGYDNRTLMSSSEDWQNIVRVWNGLRRRSTTKTDDLYGIIAIMVDLSAYEILKLDPKERMKAIIRSQSSLPIPLLYQDCDKLRDLNGKTLCVPSEIAGDALEADRGYMSVEEKGMLISSHKPDAARHLWPDAYMFSTQGPLPSSFNIRLTQLDLTISIELCRVSSETVGGSKQWVFLSKEALTHKPTMHKACGVLLLIRTWEGSIIDTEYICPLTTILRDQRDTGCQGGHSQGKAELAEQYLEGETLCLSEVSIKVYTDMTSWYKPKFRISKRLLAPTVVIRNSSNFFVFGSVALSSAMCLFAIIVCAAHHRGPLARKIMYYLVARYLFVFIELYWVMKAIVTVDKERTSRWSTRLYGEAKVTMWRKLISVFLHSFCATNVTPMVVGSVFLGLYHTYGWIWTKWLGVIGFTELGIRLVFECVGTPMFYYTMWRGWCPMKMEDVSDLPEDMTNYSRKWGERNERDRKRRIARKKRMKGWFKPHSHAGDGENRGSLQDDA